MFANPLAGSQLDFETKRQQVHRLQEGVPFDDVCAQCSLDCEVTLLLTVCVVRRCLRQGPRYTLTTYRAQADAFRAQARRPDRPCSLVSPAPRAGRPLTHVQLTRLCCLRSGWARTQFPRTSQRSTSLSASTGASALARASRRSLAGSQKGCALTCARTPGELWSAASPRSWWTTPTTLTPACASPRAVYQNPRVTSEH